VIPAPAILAWFSSYRSGMACRRKDRRSGHVGHKPWDTAAGVVIAREAGALAVDRDGTSHSFDAQATIAANPDLCHQFLTSSRKSARPSRQHRASSRCPRPLSSRAAHRRPPCTGGTRRPDRPAQLGDVPRPHLVRRVGDQSAFGPGWVGGPDTAFTRTGRRRAGSVHRGLRGPPAALVEVARPHLRGCQVPVGRAVERGQDLLAFGAGQRRRWWLTRCA
jgi:hypothetical protein